MKVTSVLARPTPTSWLITGGTGSFGRAFAVRLLADPSTSRVVILSRDELKQAEMRAALQDERMRYVIGSVADLERMETALRGIDHCVHAAAMKRVETCEENPNEAAHTNLVGTAVVARACDLAGVRKAVFLSTDKAVAPNTLYGLTKATAERLWCNWNVYTASTHTRYACTRYGNVLASRGSVVPILRAQAANGGPITITNPHATRFWMTMDDAVDLVLLAFDQMQGGETFIPAVTGTTVGDLANAIAPGVEWRVTGLGASEKLHEELVAPDEVRRTFECGRYYTIAPASPTWGTSRITGTLVPEGFTYRSDSRPMSAHALREMVG